MKIRVWYDAGDNVFYVEYKKWGFWCRVTIRLNIDLNVDRKFRTLDEAKAHIAEMKEDRIQNAARKKRRKDLSKVVYEETI